MLRRGRSAIFFGRASWPPGSGRAASGRCQIWNSCVDIALEETRTLQSSLKNPLAVEKAVSDLTSAWNAFSARNCYLGKMTSHTPMTSCSSGFRKFNIRGAAGWFGVFSMFNGSVGWGTGDGPFRGIEPLWYDWPRSRSVRKWNASLDNPLALHTTQRPAYMRCCSETHLSKNEYFGP